MHTRAKIHLETLTQVQDFVMEAKKESYEENCVFYLEDLTGDRRVDACSILGVMYASGEWGGEIYLINMTRDGYFRSWVDKYRV